MANYQYILFAADLSDECPQVGKHAVDLAQRYGARLSLAHVVQKRDESAGKEAGRALTELAGRLDIGEAEQWVVQSRSIAHQIHHLADEHGVDLIVVGSHGTHGPALLLGSTPSAVLHGAHCDVLAVLIQPQKTPSPYQHVLFAADLSDECPYVGKQAVDLAQRYGARLSLAHVVQLRDVGTGLEGTPYVAETGTRLTDEALLELNDLARELGVEDAERWVVQASSVAHQIHYLADEHGVDLIVVGSHGTHGPALLLGSTPSTVLHGAHCDVLAVLVKPPKG